MFNMWIDASSGMVKVYRPNYDLPIITALTPEAAVTAIRMCYGRGNFVRVKSKSPNRLFPFIQYPNRSGNVYEVA